MQNLPPHLTQSLDDYWLKIHQPLLLKLTQGYSDWCQKQDKAESKSSLQETQLQWVQYLKLSIETRLAKIKVLQEAAKRFKSDFKNAIDTKESREHLAIYAEKLAYSNKMVNKIAQGNLDWFDQNALHDKQIKLVSNVELDIAVIIQILQSVSTKLLSKTNHDNVDEAWRVLSLPVFLNGLITYQGHEGINIAALKCLRGTLTKLPRVMANKVPAQMIQYIYRLCLEQSANIWLRSEAVVLIIQLQPANVKPILESIFIHESQSDIFLKGRVVKQIIKFYKEQDLDWCINLFLENSSEYVKQQLALQIKLLQPEQALSWFKQLLASQNSDKLRSQVYIEMSKFIDLNKVEQGGFLSVCLENISKEKSELGLSVLINRITDVFTAQSNQSLFSGADWPTEYRVAKHKLIDKLIEINAQHSSLKIRRLAATARQCISSCFITPLLSLQDIQVLKSLQLGQSHVVSFDKKISQESLCQFIHSQINNRHGFNIKFKQGSVKVTAGFKFKFRFWRFLYEFVHSATDKRQNHNHVKGRVFYGLAQLTTKRNAEQSKTKVPGEPFYVEQELGDRDYLPLLDQVLSCLDQGWPTKPLKLFSNEGITVLTPPANLFKRLKARWTIQAKFAEIADLRNWKEGMQSSPQDYLRVLEALGFSICIKGYQSAESTQGVSRLQVDSKVSRFFPSFMPISLPNYTEVQSYFYSVYQNTIQQLLVFTGLMLGYFITQHIIAIKSFNKWRNKIPLVIGGWGTRGKSGTERLKAALFNAMGLSVMSKTTGCEAMFLYGPPNRPMKELFLFRPYDKATIWEQVFLTKLAGKLDTKVFLWECMGLTPRYIEILQSQWMKDDISTVTNCYPDHEDLQGPAGIEIPIVMQRFISKGSQVYTTEDSMFPILEDAAIDKHASLTQVDWIDCSLISDEVINRFPYEEHPNNIALVMKMAEKLGIENDFALQSMADNVVADLGVLKIYPTAISNQRKLKFINGMSANERLGAMGNWHRTGFPENTLESTPEIFTTIVINNRADRIARSKVFAAMLVQDTQADSFVIIGDNLNGFSSYLDEAWQALYTDEYFSSVQDFCKIGWELAKKYRIVTTQEILLERLDCCVNGLDYSDKTKTKFKRILTKQALDSTTESNNIDIDSLLKGSDYELNEQKVLLRLLEYVQQSSVELNQFNHHLNEFNKQNYSEFMSWLFNQFKSRFLIIENYYSTGNQTVQRIVDNALPGVESKIIGMQNIKGTGLDFIYRWQAWDQVNRLCQQLYHEKQSYLINEAASALNAWEDYGVLDIEAVIKCVEQVKQRKEAQSEAIQAELQSVLQKVNFQITKLNQSLNGANVESKWFVNLVGFIESFLDSGSAVKRRKKANKIYQAILDNTISYDRASIELAKLTKEQKGGWLMQYVAKRLLR
jgi:gamma-polyglutamate synthase